MADLATTPSPPPSIRTPDTPRFGYADSWEPYSPRKSARISSKQSSAARTPSPKSSRAPKSQPPQFQITRASANKQQQAPAGVMASPTNSPMKKRQPPPKPKMAVPSLTAEGTSNAAAFLGLPGGAGGKSDAQSTTAFTGMLPTPVKTPSRRHAEQNEANIQKIARNLFHSNEDEPTVAPQQAREQSREEELLPNPKQRRPKKYSGISMNSFTAEDIDEPIDIFTDSHDRIPKVDNSAENPFLSGYQAPAPDPVKRGKRKLIEIPGEGTITVDEAFKRNDGVVYVFRGKKVYRKFAEQDASEDSNGESGAETSPKKRFTRSSIKPRLLFPPESKGKQPEAQQDLVEAEEEDDDEEAVTDIEEAHAHIEEGQHIQSKVHDEEMPTTPVDNLDDKAPATPEAPKFGPGSPPATGRATRSSQRRGLQAEEATPVKATATARRSRRSPFDDWQRVKPAADSHGQKRSAGETLAPPHSSTKRARN